jgi:hypothetical protein
LFHPRLGQRANQLDWEQQFLNALPHVERAPDPTTLNTILKTQLLPPLADPPNLRRVHEGWNEDGYPYVYRQIVEMIDANRGFSSPEAFMGNFLGETEAVGNRIPLLGGDRGGSQKFGRTSGFSTHLQPLPGGEFMASLSREKRIFGLCKLWIILRYFAPHFPPTGCDPETMLWDWVSRVEAAQNLQDYYHLLEIVATQLKDRHAWVSSTAESIPEDAENPTSHGYLRSKKPSAGISWLEGTRYVRALRDNLMYMTPFAMSDVASLKHTFALIQNTDGLILDLRGYPQTHFQHELVRCLCQTPVQSPRYEIPVIREPNIQKRTWKLLQYTIQPDGHAVYVKPVVALIDESTQSSAEDFCMYLKIADRVTFVGRPTAGCVGNATYINLPGGMRFTFTGMRVTWPDGSPMWGIGILPDVSVEPTLTGLNAGQDGFLEKGLETLQVMISTYGHDAR